MGSSVATAAPTRELRSTTSTFAVRIALAALATMLAGFTPSYYLKAFFHAHPGRTPISGPLPMLIHVHAAVFTAWILLFAVQTALSATGHIHIHRRLGIGAAIFALAIPILGVLVAIRGGRDGWNPGGPYPDSLAFMVVGIGDVVVFTSFIAAGLYFRARPEAHKRLMTLGTLGGFMWPAITRMPIIGGSPALMFGWFSALLFAWAVRDKVVDRRIHPVSLWGSFVILAFFPLRIAMAHTAAWHSVAAWLTR